VRVLERVRQLGLPLHAGSAVVDTRGRAVLHAVDIERRHPEDRALV